MKRLLLLLVLLPLCLRADDGLLGSARASLAANDVNAAVRTLERAVASQPAAAEAHWWLAHAYAVKAQRSGMFGQISLARKSAAELQAAVAADPEHLDARMELVSFYASSPGVFGGDLARAVAEAKEIARRDPMRGLEAEARLAAAREDLVAAEQQLQLAATRNPQRVEPLLWLGAFYLRRQRFAEAAATFERALSMSPDLPRAEFGLGATLASTGSDPVRAERLLQRYLARAPGPTEPTRAHALYHLAVVHRRDDPARARRELAEALLLDPGYGDAKRALAELPK